MNLIEAAGRTHTTHPNVVLAGLIRSTDLDMNPSIRVGKLDLLQQAEPDNDDLEDDITQEPWNENPLPAEADVLDSIYIEGDDITKLRIRDFYLNSETYLANSYVLNRPTYHLCI